MIFGGLISDAFSIPKRVPVASRLAGAAGLCSLGFCVFSCAATARRLVISLFLPVAAAAPLFAALDSDASVVVCAEGDDAAAAAAARATATLTSKEILVMGPKP